MEAVKTVLVRAGKGIKNIHVSSPSPLNAKEIIQNHSHGTYTTARTISQRSIIDFKQHVDRICSFCVFHVAH
jgi:hypothetical protein